MSEALMNQQELTRTARHLKEISQQIDPTRPGNIFVKMLQYFQVEYRISLRKEIEKMLRSEATLGYMINHGQAKNFNKWLGGIRDMKIQDLRREKRLWFEAFFEGLEKDFEAFESGDDDNEHDFDHE